jgi:hypothetical protein
MREHEGRIGAEIAARAHRPAARPARATPPHRAGARNPLDLLALQRLVGNAAVARLIEEERHVHDASGGHEPPAAQPVQRTSLVHSLLRSSGQPLGKSIRSEMEHRFGDDFSDVRVHTDDNATQEVNAQAFTSGNHVVLSRKVANDKHTIAHELTHVQQQRQGPVAGTDNGSGLSISDPSDHFEQAADANATRIMRSSLPHLDDEA